MIQIKLFKTFSPIVLVVVPLLCGVVLLFHQPELPPPLLAAVLLPLAVVSWRIRRLRPLFWLVAGFVWAAFMADLRLSLTLADEWEGEDLQLVGEVVDIPRLRENSSIRFLFRIESAQLDGVQIDFPARVRLGWYQDPLPLHAGERWSLRVRLKQPHGFRNPGGYDWERWLFQQGIRATGYVRRDGENRRLQRASPGLHPLREDLSRWISQQSEHGGVLAAVAVGDRQGISQREWDLFRQTGTSHLMAISGLHVGLVSGLLFFLMRWLWSLSARLPLLLPAQQMGAVGGFVGALGYAAMAGFAIPTQRALVMVSVVMAMILFRRAVTPWSVYFTALLVLLLWDPFAVLSAGFWLSFGAVGLILYGLGGRDPSESRIRTMVRIQLVLSIGMLPMLLFMFRQGSLVAPLANLLAVPWVSLVVVPLDLLAAIFHLLSIPGAELLLGVADRMFGLVWPLLEWLGDLELSHFRFHQPDLWVVLVAMVGVLLLISPTESASRPEQPEAGSESERRGYAMAGVKRWLGGFALLPLLLLMPERPDVDRAWVTVLDVGQGLAVVVESRNRVMVYDTGDRFSDTFDAGSSVVVPFLESRGWKGVDLLVIGHSDRDHIGGLESLLDSLPVTESISSVPELVEGASSCLAGDRWRWDGVSIEVIHPQRNNRFSGNNSSCVIRVEAGGESILLPGDIERGAERLLILEQPDLLKVDGVVVPHHGSKTSSTPEWLDAVDPRWAVFPVGYRNRYRFPKEDVVARYRERGIKFWESSHTGALRFHLGAGELPQSWRQLNRRIWSD